MLRIIFICWLSLALLGCSGLQPKENQKNAQASSEPVIASAMINGTMDGKTMYQIMVGEMLYEKKHYPQAYAILMPLAHQTEDAGLAERAFELSMLTYDVEAIKNSTLLLKKVAPKNPKGWKAAYLLSLAEGKIEQAFDEWQNYLQLADEEFEQVYLKSANRIMKSIPQERSLAFLHEIEKEYPEEKSVAYGIGTLALQYDRYHLALEALQQAVENYQDQADSTIYDDVHLKLINVYVGLQAYSEGLKFLKDYAQNNPGDWLFQEHFARLEVKANRLKGAEQRYRNIVEGNPKAYTAQLSLALLLLEGQSYNEAEVILKKLAVFPRYKNISNYYLGTSQKEQGDLEAAKGYFKEVSQGSFWVDAQIQLASIESMQTTPQNGLLALQNVQTTSNEQKVKLLKAKAALSHQAEMYSEAVSLYDEALQIDPQNIELLFAKSIVFYESDDLVAYETTLKEILSINKNEVDALNALGYFYVEQNKQLDLAEELIDKALALAPNAYYILDSKGWLRYTQKRFAEAELLLSQALEKQMDDEVLLHLVKTKWALGKEKQAEALWLKHYKSFPENAPLQMLIKKLKRQSLAQ